MLKAIEIALRGMLLFYLLIGSGWSCDVSLVTAKDLSGWTGDVYFGMPVPYCKDRHDDWYDETAVASSGIKCDGEALAFDLAVLGVLAIVFTFLLQRALRSDALAHPQRPPNTAGEDPAVRALRRRSRRLLLLVIIGSLLGLGLLTGTLGWWRGARLRREYRSLGLRPSWMSTTASVAGLAVLVTLGVCTLGWVLLT
jgi:hypothetical protein